MDFQQKKLEKELQELKKLIDVHFVQRKKVLKISKYFFIPVFLFLTFHVFIFIFKIYKDEEELTALEDRIEKRKEYRAAQLAERARVIFSSKIMF